MQHREAQKRTQLVPRNCNIWGSGTGSEKDTAGASWHWGWCYSRFHYPSADTQDITQLSRSILAKETKPNPNSVEQWIYCPVLNCRNERFSLTGTTNHKICFPPPFPLPGRRWGWWRAHPALLPAVLHLLFLVFLAFVPWGAAVGRSWAVLTSCLRGTGLLLAQGLHKARPWRHTNAGSQHRKREQPVLRKAK